MKFKVGDRVVITKLTENWDYNSTFIREIKPNKDTGRIRGIINKDRVTIKFDRNVSGWGDERREQHCCIDDLGFVGQEITGRVMVIGEL